MCGPSKINQLSLSLPMFNFCLSITELAMAQGGRTFLLMLIFMFEISFEFPATGARDFVLINLRENIVN